MRSIRNIVVIAAVILFSSLSAQDPVWIKHYGPNYYGEGLKLAPDGSNGIYGTGKLTTNCDFDGQPAVVLGQEDILLGRWDANGNTLWVRTAGGECQLYEHENSTQLVFDPLLEHVVITGTYNCPTAYFGSQVIHGSWDDDYDMFVAAYDNAGECLWANGVRGSVRSRMILVDQSSVIHVIGNTRSFDTYFGTAPFMVPLGGFVARYSATGEVMSAERILVNGELNWADLLSTNEYILAGKVSAGAALHGQPIPVGSPGTDGFVARTSQEGTVAWVTNFRSSNTAQIVECAANGDGDVYAVGYFLDSLFLSNDTLIGLPGTPFNFFLSALSPTGDVEWTTPISSPELIYIHGLEIGVDGEVYLFGEFNHEIGLGSKTMYSSYPASGVVASFDGFGECHAVLTFGPIVTASGSVLPTNNGLFISCEYDSAMAMGSEIIPVSQTGWSDLFIAKFDSLSGFTGISTLAMPGSQPLTIYANPNNGLCTVDLPSTVHQGSDLVLTIYNAQGQVVQQAPMVIGNGTLQLDIQAQAKGMYMVELLDGRQRYSGTIVFE